MCPCATFILIHLLEIKVLSTLISISSNLNVVSSGVFCQDYIKKIFVFPYIIINLAEAFQKKVLNKNKTEIHHSD